MLLYGPYNTGFNKTLENKVSTILYSIHLQDPSPLVRKTAALFWGFSGLRCLLDFLLGSVFFELIGEAR